ncbi:MAG TPA: hypothetical protein DCY97_17645 [Marinilabiliales bacterium]|nr:hypothetical protein [Marinilabiliales bacterium]
MRETTPWRSKAWNRLLTLLFLLAFNPYGWGQTLLEENFDYTAGTFLTANGWTAHSGTGTAPITVVTPGLDFAGYIGSGIGNAASISETGEDVNRTFTSQTIGTVYAAMIVKTSATNSSGYFFNFGLNPFTTTYFTRLWVNATGDALGIGTSVSTWVTITPATPTLVVVKYNIDTKESSLYVFNTFPTEEPATADATFTETATSVGGIALRQYNAAQDITIDGIRVAKTWAEAVKYNKAPVAEFSPANGAIDVNPSENITLTFEDAIYNTDASAIDDANISSLITLKKTDAAGADVPFTATISGDKTLVTIDPNSKLDFTQLYYVAIAPVEDIQTKDTTLQSITFTTATASAAKQITAFSLPGQAASATITDGGATGTITVEMPATADLSALAATFTLSAGASAAIGATPQVSIVTTNDFSSAKVYTVTAEDASTKDWTVSTFSHPDLVADATSNNVDNNLEITFTDDATWRTAITAVKVDATTLTLTDDYTIASGTITLLAGSDASLTVPGTKTITVVATGYTDATVSQEIMVGAINTTNSTVTIDQALALSTTSVITLTAKDQYNNLISGYVAKFDVTVTDGSATTNESYTINTVAYDATSSDVDLSATNGSGEATVTVVMPATVDGGDGLSVQLQLSDGTTNVGSAYSYSAPLTPDLSASATLTELTLDGGTIELTVLNETFADATLDKANFSLNNAPTGVTVDAVSYGTATTATLTLAYDGTDFDANVTNLTVTCAGAEFTGGNPLTSNNLNITATVETTPTVTTDAAITTNGYTTATWGGDITDNGGEAVTEKGLCWNTTGTPTTADGKTTEGAVGTEITGDMTGLTVNTLYYVRAYATNIEGTSYGDEQSFTTLTPSVTLDVLGASTYYAGDVVTVTWTSGGVDNVKIELYDGTSYSDLVASTAAADGTEDVTIPAASAYGVAYKIRISDASNASYNSESSAFTVKAVTDNLADLIAMSANSIVKYTGKATVTYTRTSRNQKYIQDATAAVLIDDNTTAPGYITDTYAIGEGISNVEGKVTLYNGLIELVPQATTGEKVTGNPVITPEVRTIASLTHDDQCKLVKIVNYTFDPAGTQYLASGNFVSSKNYDITGIALATFAYRTAFSEADYIGGVIPTTPITTVALVGQYNTQMQITARNLADFQSAEATVSSSVYTVGASDITAVPYSAILAVFESNLTAATGATFETYEADGTTVATDLATGYKVIVTAEDGITQQTYTVTKDAALTGKDFLSYAFGTSVGVLTDPAIAVTVPYTADETNLTATFTLSDGASAKIGTDVQTSGVTANNFTSPVVYTITAEDGTTKDWTVTVTKEATPSSEKDILTFSVLGVDATVTSGDHTVTATLPYGTDRSALVATFTLSAAASAKVGATDQESGVTANDFTNSVTYIITAEDATTQDWVVTITNAAPSTEAFVTSSVYTVDGTAGTITNVPFGTDLAAFKTNITPAADATFEVYQADGTTVAADLATGYKVIATAQDGITTKTYTITIDAEVVNLLEENFDYTAGTYLTANGWTAHSGAGTAPITVVAPGLDFAGYIGSGVGNAASIVETGEDVNRTFVSQTVGTVYAAMIVKTSATNSSGYFFNFGLNPFTSTYFTRLWVNATGDALGIGTAVSTWVTITPETPTLVVVKYNIDTKESSLYVFNTFPTEEPAVAAATFTETATSVGGIALRQFNAAQDITIDGIRVAKTWDEAVKAGSDTDAPVATFAPANGATTVAESSNVTLSFDEDVFNAADGSVIANGDLAAKISFFETATPANTVAFAATISGKEVTVDPTAASLKLGMQYTVSLLANKVEDAAGNENTESNTSFTVRPASTDATVTSTEYTVDNTGNTISGISYSVTLAVFKSNIVPATSATFEVYLADGTTVATDLQDGYKLICTAEDEVTTKTYIVNKNAFVNTETKVLTYSFAAQTGAATINETNQTVTVEVAYGTNVANLVASFTLSTGATAKVGTDAQVSGVTANNFTNPVVYTITAEDAATTQDWTVTVTVKAPNTDATLSDMKVDGTSVTGFVASTLEYTVNYPYGTTAIPAVTYTLNDVAASAIKTDATVMPGATTVEVTAQDGITKNTYTVNFAWDAASTEAYVTSTVYTVDGTAGTITNVPYNASLSAFKSNLTAAAHATFEVYESDSITVATNLASGQKVIVTAQDGTTKKVYSIALNEALASDLFFSEYIEGSSNNKAFEIFNPTSSTVDLSNYMVKLSNNGLGWGITTTGADTRYVLPLSGTLAPKEVYVVTNSSANSTILALADLVLVYSATANVGDGTNVASFNGNDALGLFKNNVLIDVFGGELIITNFNVAGTLEAAKDHTIIRKSSVISGNTDWTTSSGTNADDSEWIVSTLDDFTNLGSHALAVVDETAPVVTFNPENGTIGVLVSTSVTLAFDENVYKAADGSAFAANEDVASMLEFYETATPANTVAFAATISGKVITIVPSANLGNNIQYTVVLKANSVEDLSGNEAALAQASFTTIDAAAPVVELTAPVGGETYYAGDNVSITWNSANIANVKIEAYVPSNTTWEELVASTDAADGNETITIPADAAYATTYKIRISDATNAAVADSSAAFAVIAVAADIVQLRAMPNGAVAKLAGKAVVTFTQSSRNQKFIQDASGAILIDDSGAKITSAYIIGDEMTGLEGSLTEYGGMKEFVPTKDPGAPTATGLTVTPQVIALDEFAASFESYESELVTFEAVKFVDADGTVAFTTGKSFGLSDGTNTANFYTNFYQADYIGDVLPVTRGVITGIANSRTTGNYITSRNASELVFPSDNAKLSDLLVDGTTISEFGADVFVYTVELASAITVVPTVTATAADANALVEVVAATAIPGITMVNVIAEDAETMLTYEVRFTYETLSNDATLSSLTVDGDTVAGFDSDVFDYSVILPYGTTSISTVDGTATFANATVVATQATALPGDATVKVIAEDQVTELTYTVHFSVTPNNVATLSSLMVDGTLVEGFSADVTSYMMAVASSATPVVSAVATDTNATIGYEQIASIPDTAFVTVTAEDAITKLIYQVVFVDQDLSHDATLSDLTVDGATVTGFDAAVFEYTLELPHGTTLVPTVGATSANSNAEVTLTQAAALPSDAVVFVKAEDGVNQNSYIVHFIVAPNSDATLSDLKVGGTTVSGFSASVYEYSIELPYNTTSAPEVAATATDVNADVTITQASALPGNATVSVIAEDGETTLTYTVHFTLGAVPTFTVTFHVTDENGAVVSGATVQFNSESALTNAQGIAEFNEVAPVTDAPFTVSKAGDIYEAYSGSVTVTDADITVEVVLQLVGINEQSSLVSSVFPNPTDGKFELILNYYDAGAQVTITDITGKVILSQEIVEVQSVIDLAGNKQGVYFIHVVSGNQYFNGKMVLN